MQFWFSVKQALDRVGSVGGFQGCTTCERKREEAGLGGRSHQTLIQTYTKSQLFHWEAPTLGPWTEPLCHCLTQSSEDDLRGGWPGQENWGKSHSSKHLQAVGQPGSWKPQAQYTFEWACRLSNHTSASTMAFSLLQVQDWVFTVKTVWGKIFSLPEAAICF